MKEGTKGSKSTKKRHPHAKKRNSQSRRRKIQASSAQTPINPTRDTKDSNDLLTDWIPFFKDSENAYINDLAKRTRQSPTLSAILQSKVNYTKGSGFTILRDGQPVEVDSLPQAAQDWLMSCNSLNQSFHDVFGDIVMNWVYYGNVYPEIERKEFDGGTFVAPFVQDATKIRINKAKTVAYISSFWREIGTGNSPDDRKTPVATIDLWDGEIDSNADRFLIHKRRRVSEFDFYGLPDYIGSLKDADIEYLVDTFNLTKLRKGFFPSALIQMVGDAPEGMSAEEYVQEIKDRFTGEENNDGLLVELLDTSEQFANVQLFDTEEQGEFVDLEKSAIDGIIRGNRWFPALAGLETSGKLGSNQELINQWRIVMNNVVIPEYQNPCLDIANTILKLAGFEFEVTITNKPPIGIDDRVEPSDVMTVNEQREALGLEPLEDEQELEEDGADD